MKLNDVFNSFTGINQRVLWDSRNGTAVKVTLPDGSVTYRAKPHVSVKKHQYTEAEDNAIGRALRRRQNRIARNATLPFAKRS